MVVVCFYIAQASLEPPASLPSESWDCRCGAELPCGPSRRGHSGEQPIPLVERVEGLLRTEHAREDMGRVQRVQVHGREGVKLS